MKVKSQLSIVIIVFISISCNSYKKCSYITDYYQLIYSAEKAYYEKNYKKVYDEMAKATKNCELINQRGIYEMLKYAESAAKIGKNNKALILIRDLISNGYKIEQLKNNEAFLKLIDTPKWEKIEKDYSKMQSEYIKTINLDLRDQISEMIDMDQYHRKMLSIRGINKDSIILLINTTDSINDIKFKKIIKKFGYPNEQIIGGYNIDNKHINPDILLFHFDDYDFYSEVLLKFINNGEALPQSLGNFVDSYQRRSQSEKKYIYGIYDNVGKDQIINYNKLDERRMSIGLSPMKLKKEIDSLKRLYFYSKKNL